MDISKLIETVNQWLARLVPLFRVVWACTVVLGIVMFITAYILKKDPSRKKSPWIVGGIGLLMVISSGTQLTASLF